MIWNIFSFLKNMSKRPRPASSSPSGSGQKASSGSGLGPSAAGPRQRETHTYHVRPIVNWDFTERVEEIAKRGGTLSVDIAENRVPTANGTVVKIGEIVLICGVCGLPSEEKWHCDLCSIPLCVPHVACVEVPDTKEILHMCPSCCRKYYAEWDTWRGVLRPPFSIRKIIQQSGGRQ